MSKRVVGVIPSFNGEQYYLNIKYVKWIQHTYNVNPVFIIQPSDVLQCTDLVLPGGVDIDPMFFGEDNTSSFNVNRDLDMLWDATINLAVNGGKNIFGICRGFQFLCCKYLITSTSALEFRQHIPDHDQSELSVARGTPTHHVVNLAGGKMDVNSMHHQGVVFESSYINSIKDSGIVTWYTSNIAPKKYTVVEAVSFKQGDCNITAVQWHPEEF
jgi:putative glutamine amidotransferase